MNYKLTISVIANLLLLYLLWSHHCPECIGVTTTTIDTVYVDTTHHIASATPKKKAAVHVPIVDSASGTTDSATATLFTACHDDSTISVCAEFTVLGSVVGDVKFDYQNKLGYVIHENTNTYIPVTSKQRWLYLGGNIADNGSVSPQGSVMFRGKQITYQYDLRLKQHRVGLMVGAW